MKNFAICAAILGSLGATSLANAGPTYYWTTVSPSQDIRSMSGFIEFEPGQEGFSYEINCSSGGVSYGSCSGTVNGVYYLNTDLNNPVYPYFSPVRRIELSINGNPGIVRFSKFNAASPVLGYLKGAGTFIENRRNMFNWFEMSNVNTVSFFASDGLTCMGPACNGPLTGYWTLDPASVPVPATLALLGLGLAGIGAARRKQA